MGKSAGPSESQCVTNCEAAWYQCNDSGCQQKVLDHYEKTKGIEEKKKEEKKEEKKAEKGEAKKEEKKEEKKAEKAALLAAAPVASKNKPMQLTAEQQKAAHWGCTDACKPSPVDSRCV